MTDDARDGLLDEATQAAAFLLFAELSSPTSALLSPLAEDKRPGKSREKKIKSMLIIQARGRAEPDRGRAVLQKITDRKNSPRRDRAGGSRKRTTKRKMNGRCLVGETARE